MPYVPTPFEVVYAMLEVAHVGPGDTVMDLGSGDGRIVIVAAEKYGARGVGIELKPELVELSNENASKAGVADRAQFRRADLFETDMRGVSVLTMYLLPSVNLSLRLRILDQLAPGARVVSHSFDMGDWAPDEHLVVGGADVYFWIVPANAAGTWRLTVSSADGAPDASADVDVQQHFQEVHAEVRGASSVVVRRAELRGDELKLELVGFAKDEPLSFTGHVAGRTIVGTLSDGRQARLERLREGRISTERKQPEARR